MNRTAELAFAVATLALIAAAVRYVALAAGDPARTEALLLAAAAGLAAVAAHLSAGLAQRPVLALSVPLLAGWCTASASGLDPMTTLLLAGLAGALVGALSGALAGGARRWAAALTLLFALAAERAAALLAPEPWAATVELGGAAALAALALGALVAGWWAQAGLAAALLHHGRPAAASASLGLRATPWLAALGAWGGVAGGWAGAVLAAAGAAPPTVVSGLVLAAAALAAGGTMAATFALTAGLWLLPQLVQRARPEAPDLAPWLAAGAVLVVLASAAARAAATAGERDG